MFTAATLWFDDRTAPTHGQRSRLPLGRGRSITIFCYRDANATAERRWSCVHWPTGHHFRDSVGPTRAKAIEIAQQACHRYGVDKTLQLIHRYMKGEYSWATKHPGAPQRPESKIPAKPARQRPRMAKPAAPATPRPRMATKPASKPATAPARPRLAKRPPSPPAAPARPQRPRMRPRR